MRLSVFLAAILAVTASEPQPPIRNLVTELEIGGPDEARDEYTFASIVGLAFDKEGRVIVNDIKENVVRIYGSDGKFAYRFGRPGAGPGDFGSLLGGVFGPDGLFWIRDDQNPRVSAFELGPERATFRKSIHLQIGRPIDRTVPVSFDQQGRVFQPGTFSDPVSGKMLPYRLLIDTSGRVLRGDTLGVPKGDSIGDGVVTEAHKSGGRVSGYNRYMYYQPFGASLSVAYAANGEYARAITSAYDVEWRDASGKLLRHLKRSVKGPPLSANERRAAQKDIDEFVAMAKVTPTHGVPARKSVIRDMAFDQLGRLWIFRHVAAGDSPEADLYDANGRWMAIVRWPAGIDPARTRLIGARGDRVLAIAKDSLDVQWVTRLVMK